MLTTHRAERGGPLVAALGQLLSQVSGDPFAREIVAVPSAGVERWLAQQLSQVLGAVDGDGVCANVIFPSYRRLLDDAVAAADPGYASSIEVWAPDRLVWPLMEVLGSCAGQEWCRPLARHLGLDGSGDNGRRLAVASMLARHFDAYGRSRPELFTAWLERRDEQGDGTPLPDDLRWQAELWRHLRHAVGVPTPAELLAEACAALRARPESVGLPQRFSIFGATRIPPSRIAVVQALAEGRDVHLWLHHPSPALWETVHRSGRGPGRRRDDVLGEQVRNPLLASLSRDVRELQQLLEPVAGVHHAAPPRPDTTLGLLQQQLADDVVPTQLRLADDTIRVYACHGRARQVEVVREAILGLLAADATLEPRDIVIMCPDVETFAPLVAASFGMADEPDGHPAARMRVRLADRSLRQTNPLLAVLSQLLDLAAERITATQLLDLAGAAPVRRVFGFDDDDLETIRDWAVSAGARWGLDAQHRAAYQLCALAQGTWRAALDRVLVGVAMEEGTAWLRTALPLDDVESGDIDLAGRFAEFVDRVHTATDAFAMSHTVADWAGLLSESVLRLGAGAQAWQELQLRSELDDLAESAADTDVPIGLRDVTAVLRRRLAGRPTRASFRTGTLTVCTLVPMRSVPHRVICLIGMDDGAFPRRGVVDGDDLLARASRTGERDVRSEDRQLFLDAICAAEQHLLVAYTGANPRTGAEVPPCVPLGELLDAIDAMAHSPHGGPARDHVVVRHPLQPFDARNFAAGALGNAAPFSFDPAGLAGARAGSTPRVPVRALVAAPLAASIESTVALADLIRFVQHPTRAFLRQRLGISAAHRDDDPIDVLPIDLAGLEKWAVGDRVLRNRLAGVDIADCLEIENLRGELPPGPLGQIAMRSVGRTVDALIAACADQRVEAARTADVQLELGDGRVLVGTVGNVCGDTVLTITYSTLAAKHRLAAWIEHLALRAAGLRTRAVSVGRARSGIARAEYAELDAEWALTQLRDLVALRDLGLTEPLPLAAKTSATYAKQRASGRSVDQSRYPARSAWEGGAGAENAESEHELAFGRQLPFDDLFAAPPRSGEAGWCADESSRFGVLARRLWMPVLAHERVIES